MGPGDQPFQCRNNKTGGGHDRRQHRGCGIQRRGGQLQRHHPQCAIRRHIEGQRECAVGICETQLLSVNGDWGVRYRPAPDGYCSLQDEGIAPGHRLWRLHLNLRRRRSDGPPGLGWIQFGVAWKTDVHRGLGCFVEDRLPGKPALGIGVQGCFRLSVDTDGYRHGR